jgi:hypothetical protein
VSLALFAAAVTRRLFDKNPDCMVSETLRGMPGAAPGGRRGLGVTGPGGGGAGGAGGARPSGTGMGGLPVPT